MFLPIHAPMTMIVLQSTPVSVIVLTIFSLGFQHLSSLKHLLSLLFPGGGVTSSRKSLDCLLAADRPFPQIGATTPRYPGSRCYKLEEGVIHSFIEKQSTESKG